MKQGLVLSFLAAVAAWSGSASTNDAEALLRTWCDAMIAYQVRDVADPRVRGGFLCPACAQQHGRVCDVAYPMTCLFVRTGDRKYLECAVAAVTWSRTNLTREGGGRLDNDFKSDWWGITVFAQVAIGKTLLSFGERLPEDVRTQWRRWFDAQTDYLENRLNAEGVFNVNYSAAYCEAMALAWKLSGERRYLERARQTAESLRALFRDDGMLAGEKHPPTFVSANGFRAVDIGYNMEESLPALYHYCALANEAAYAKELDRLSLAHLEFVLPDGGIDNSAGSRAEKWTYWGSRTSDGALALFAEMANRDLPGSACAAERHLGLLRRCTSRASHLLAGGLHYDAADEGACIHHAFTHAKALADYLLAHGSGRTPKGLGDLPRSRAYGYRTFPSFGTTLAAVGPWRATFTVNDVHHDETGTMCGGGSPTLLWHEEFGLVLAGTPHRYSALERDNMQIPRREPDVRCMTPRLEGADWSSDCETNVTAVARMRGDAFVYSAANARFSVSYSLTATSFAIRANGRGKWHYVLPVDVQAAGRLAMRTNGIVRHERTERGAWSFSPVAGILADYRVIDPPADGDLIVEFDMANATTSSIQTKKQIKESR